MQEVWKDVAGYEGLYQVSNLGRVASLERITSKGVHVPYKLLSQSNDKDGYKKVGLYKDGKVEVGRVHRLVATAFIPNPYNYPVINHKDENKQNNVVDNLEWCTVKYNANYGTAIQRRSDKLRGRPLSDETKRKISIANSGENSAWWGKHQTEEAKQHLSMLRKGENNPFYGKHHTDETRQRMRENSPHLSGSEHPMYGKQHTDDAKRKMSEKQMGDKNHMYGKLRVNNGIENKTILPEELDYYLSLGYVRGMLKYTRKRQERLES